VGTLLELWTDALLRHRSGSRSAGVPDSPASPEVKLDPTA
jgi:hypothetical protein